MSNSVAEFPRAANQELPADAAPATAARFYPVSAQFIYPTRRNRELRFARVGRSIVLKGLSIHEWQPRATQVEIAPR